jgi:hypothetical protein
MSNNELSAIEKLAHIRMALAGLLPRLSDAQERERFEKYILWTAHIEERLAAIDKSSDEDEVEDEQ